MKPTHLMDGHEPKILSAIDKQSYYVNKASEVHENKYDYSKADYINAKTKIIITCPIHGDFKQLPSNHLVPNGCRKCASDESGFNKSNWIKRSKQSENFDSYKLYKIRCVYGDEEFYKIGITYKKLDRRFSGESNMPYDYETIEIIESDSPEYIWNLEKELHRRYVKYQYIPNIKFGGMYECFSYIGDKYGKI